MTGFRRLGDSGTGGLGDWGLRDLGGVDCPCGRKYWGGDIVAPRDSLLLLVAHCSLVTGHRSPLALHCPAVTWRDPHLEYRCPA
ncbi:hypothetical protein E2C01_038928 [Portunus trituberculatus]|uniref:Uncharacterized protein n=1 Tax=Portunus trituberculatus TaxID=210409 RepID=A0A5B7FI94_PORTR|nr:hypothetical protein [Portunus trituberculatus]